MSNIDLTSLDFLTIKKNLKDYLTNQEELSDYDLEGSNMNILLDILAYSGLLTAHQSYIAINETSLETAQNRKNIVSRAKSSFGYVPRSKSSAKAIIKIVISPSSNELLTAPLALVIPKGTNFKGLFLNKSMNFITTQDYVVNLVNNKYTFGNIIVYQGKYKTSKYRVDSNIINQKFVIEDIDVDTSTLNVFVRDNEQSINKNVFLKFTEFSSVFFDSNVFYLSENYEEKFEVNFGDGISTGKKLSTNNIVELEYIYTEGQNGNNISDFVLDSFISNYPYVLTTIQSSNGGSDREDKESIRRNAYPYNASQKRAVTAEDYKAIITASFPNIKTISCWGGENNVPVMPRKVFICIKPVDSDFITQTDKLFINNILKNKKILGTDVQFVDPDYTFLRIETFFKYNSLLTNSSKTLLENIIKEKIISFNNDILEKFDGVFRNSNLLKIIENSQTSITSCMNKIYMLKYFTTSTTSNFDKIFYFPTPIYNVKGNFKVIKSDSFVINNELYYIEDVYQENQTTKKKISLFKASYPNPILVKDDVGYIDFNKNLIRLYDIQTEVPQNIKITVIPNSDDIIPDKNQLLSIREEEIFCSGEIDTFAVNGSNGSENYTHISRLTGF